MLIPYLLTTLLYAFVALFIAADASLVSINLIGAAMDSHLPTPTLSVFALGGILWFGMLFIGGVDRKIITLTFIAGLAYVLTFIDGVAPIAKYTISGNDPFWNGMYVTTQQVSWWGAASWAIFIFAVLKKKSWAIPVGIFAGAMSMLAGYPLGLHNALFEVHRFSMFLPRH